MSESKPVRIQLSRKKGWKMPPNTVKVSRPSPYGNPFFVLNEEGWPLIASETGIGYNCDAEQLIGEPITWSNEQQARVALFRDKTVPHLTARIGDLRGKNLACWCALDRPCHADVLLKLANRPICEDPTND